jgi:uncharacterized protein (TIGR00297 family)
MNHGFHALHGSSSETLRQIVHITMGGWALLLRWITWQQAALVALAALAFNAFVLPRFGGRRLYRESDRGGAARGILIYPIAVLLLVLVFRHRLDIAAAAWGILAAGDGFATIVGRAVGRRPLPWNHEKTVEGTLAFILAGSAAGVLLALWVRPSISPAPSIAFGLVAPVAAAIAAALVETIPVKLDDNVSVPGSAAAVLWMASLIAIDPRGLPGLHVVLLTALVLNVAVAAAGLLAKTVTIGGAITGVAIGTIIYAGSGPRGWTLLLAAFVVASAVSRIGIARKESLGIAEERGGRRGPGNAIANTGVAACAAALALVGPDRALSELAMTAALTAGASDTVASEIGKAWGRRTFLTTTFRPVPPGTPGAVSLEGTAALVVASALLAWLAALLGLIGYEAIPIIVLAAVAASFLEGALGATYERSGILNNDLLNFVTTASAAAVAILVLGAVR